MNIAVRKAACLLSHVIHFLRRLSGRLKLRLDRDVWLHVVPATEKFLQPNVKADEQITAAHLLDF